MPIKYYILILLSWFVNGDFGQEPVCTRLHYEEMVLRRLADLERIVEDIRGKGVKDTKTFP